MKVSFDMKGDFDGALSWLKRVSESKPTMVANSIGREGERSLASHTPKDTGKTAAGWKSEVTTKGHVTEIAWVNNAHPEASVNIAKLIEVGHGTGTGGYVPPHPYIKQAMDPIFSNAGDKIARELIK